MSTARRLHHTHADYVRLERDSPIKHEYCDGEIYAMAGGTAAHGALAAAVISSFGAQLPAGCRALTSDVRVRIEASDLSTYPDALIICGAASYDAIDTHAVTNPVVVVEVTSPSSEDYDHGEKLSHYKQLPSLKAVVIVSHKTRRVTVHSRAGTWETREFRPGETAIITEPALKLEVDRLYAVLEGL
jgi:Uma2 family endonuclease